MRRLYLVEVEPSALAEDLKRHDAQATEQLITETFTPQSDGSKLTQLQAISHFGIQQIPKQIWTKTRFKVMSGGWKLKRLGRPEEISSEEYYELLLSSNNVTVEQKVRTQFELDGNSYTLDVNGSRNYSVMQIDIAGERPSRKALFRSLPSVTVVGELFMSLEETFCRLYLKKPQALQEARAF